MIWPQFRGVNSSGVAAPGQRPPVSLDITNNLLWRSSINTGESSPCIWEDKIFLTGFNQGNQQLHVMCFNRLNGRLIWNRKVPATDIETFHASASPADATPATDGEHVYVHFGSYGLLCYDMDGTLVWDYKIPVNADKFRIISSKNFEENTQATPAIIDNKLYVRTNDHLYAFGD